MSLRRRLWLVLGGLFLVPLAVGALVLLLAVPDARSDRVSGDVDSSAAAVRADLIEECRSLGLAVQVASLSLGSDAAPILRDLVRNSGVDYAAVFDGDGTAVAEGGRLPAGVDDAAGPAPVHRGRVRRLHQPGPRAAAGPGRRHDGRRGGRRRQAARPRAADRPAHPQRRGRDRAAQRSRLSSSPRSTTTRRSQLVAASSGHDGLVTVEGWTARVDPPGNGLPWTTVVAAEDPGNSSRTNLHRHHPAGRRPVRRRPGGSRRARAQPALHRDRRGRRAGRGR